MRELRLFEGIIFHSPILLPKELDENRVIDDLMKQNMPALPLYLIRDGQFIDDINRNKPRGAPDIKLVIVCCSYPKQMMA